MKKKILSSLLIGAFVFGVGTASAQPSGENFVDKVKASQARHEQMQDNDKSKRHEPPKDKDGKSLPPPNHDGDKSNRPEPPKDKDGKPIAPPNHDGDKSNRPEPPKDKDGKPLPPPNHGDKFEQK